MPENSITVVGSANVDLIMKMDRLPRPGETVTDAEFVQTFGGKGANQALAAARSGGKVAFVAGVGDDIYGGSIIENMNAAGVDTSFTLGVPGYASGTALIMVGGQGENYLSVAPGANYQLFPRHIDLAWERIAGAALVMVQAEIPLATVQHTIERAHSAGKPVMFNVAPAKPLGGLPLGKVEWLVVNETEASFMTGLPVLDEAQSWQAADALLAQGPHTVILTLGAQGCIAVGQGLRLKSAAFPVQAVDTTAAGDVFCGALAVALIEGKLLLEGLQFASAASAIAVTRLGAQPSIPSRHEIDQFLREQARWPV